MNSKLLKHLDNAQLEITRAIYYSDGALSFDDEYMLREVMGKIPKIIETLEKENIIAEVRK